MNEYTVENGARDEKGSQTLSSTGDLHLLPLLPPPQGAEPPPALLGELRQERLAFATESPRTSWVTTSHVFPAAYPRAASQPFSRIGSSELAAQMVQELAEGQQVQLWHTVQRIVPVRLEESAKRNEYGTTMILLQPDLLVAELLEPMLSTIAMEMERSGKEKTSIEEVFCLNVQDGEGGLHDGVRDLQQFIESYMPCPTSLGELSTYGPQWHRGVLTRQRKGVARRDRKIVVVTQGMTAGMVALLAASSPNLLDSIIAISPESSSRPDASSWDGKVQQLHARFSRNGKLNGIHYTSETVDQDQAWSQLSDSTFSGRLDVLTSIRETSRSPIWSRFTALPPRAHVEQVGEHEIDPFRSPRRLGELISRLLKRPERRYPEFRAHL